MARRYLVPLRDILLQLLRAAPPGVRAVELRQALRPVPPATTVASALRRLCHQGLVVRVGRGRYALARASRTREAAESHV